MPLFKFEFCVTVDAFRVEFFLFNILLLVLCVFVVVGSINDPFLLIRRALLLLWYLELSDVCILSLFLLLLRLVFCRVVDGRDDVSDPLSSTVPNN